VPESPASRLNHLNLAVSDVEQSRRFYEAWFGFDAGPTEWLGDALFLRDAYHFDLALTPVDGSSRPDVGRFHFGFQLETRAEVRSLLERMTAEEVPIVALDDEADFFAFKCRDPDGYLVEVAWSKDG
jgi:catechol-2,3-dioxygenase